MNANFFARNAYNRFRSQNLNKHQEVFFDPATIALITKIVIDVIRLMKSCRKTDNDAVRTVHHPDRRELITLRRIIRRRIGVRNYIRHGSSLMNAILEQGKFTSHNEVKYIYRGF